MIKQINRIAIFTSLLQAPAWAFLQGTLPFLLYKVLQSPPLAIAIVMAAKPVSGMLAPLWQQVARGTENFARINIALSSLIAGAALFCASFTDAIWLWTLLTIFCTAILKGKQGAWSELLRGCTEPHRSKIQTDANTLSYCASAALPICFGMILDSYLGVWHLVAATCGLLLITAAFLQWSLLSNITAPTEGRRARRSWSLSILLHDRQYLWYISGTMVAGAGLILLQPAIPRLLMDHHALSFTHCAMALGGAKAVGYLASARPWQFMFARTRRLSFAALIAALTALFPILLISFGTVWGVYGAYIYYGMFQAGSELSWQMAPAIFGGKESSLPYAGAGHIMNALRGSLMPMLGAWILSSVAGDAVFYISIMCSLCGALLLLLGSRERGDERTEAPNQSSLGAQSAST